MYDLLNLYGCTYNAQYPVVCVDEKSKQLLEDKRKVISMKPGSPEKYDGEYKRMGTQNIFVAVEPLAGKRYIKVTNQRKKVDFAIFIKELVAGYPQAKKIRLVADNLNTHFESSFHETFNLREASSILEKIEFHYTPKHGSWLNMAEIEINVLSRQCLNRQIPTLKAMKVQIAAWSRSRNKMKAGINWQFTVEQAEKKLKLKRRTKELNKLETRH